MKFIIIIIIIITGIIIVVEEMYQLNIRLRSNFIKTNSMAYGNRKFNTAFTKALQ